MTNKKISDFMSPIDTSGQNRASQNQYASYQRWAAVYLLRLALGKQKDLHERQILKFFEGDLGKITELEEYPSAEEIGSFDESIVDWWPFNASTPKPVLVKVMREQLNKLLGEGISSSEPLFDNVRLLGNTLKLSQAEQELLVLCLLMRLFKVFFETVDDHRSSCSIQSTIDVLKLMTARPVRDIRKALQPNSLLMQIGWIRIHPELVPMEVRLRLPRKLLEILLRQHDSVEALFANFFRASSHTKLKLNDCAHLQSVLDVLQPYLRTALAEKQAGVNILIYGPPDASKTQLAQLLAQTLDASLYEVLCADDQEDDIVQGKEARFAACNLSQKLLSKRPDSLLLFDEAEDVFPTRYYSYLFSGEGYYISWINRQLENYPVPIIWISNRPRGIDKAYLRRFSYLVEIDKMPVSIRQRIGYTYNKGLEVSAKWGGGGNLIGQSLLTPAQVGQACPVAKNDTKTGSGTNRADS